MTAPGEVVIEAGAEVPVRRRRGWVTAGAGVVAVLVLVLTAFVSFRWGAGGAPQTQVTASPKASPTRPPTNAEIYAALAPSVVTIIYQGGGGDGRLGTGVIASANGIILTAYHVVQGGGSVQVVFADGTKSAAMVIGADPSIDIAALVATTMPTVLVPAVLGNSGRLAIGDTVMAIGNQLGLISSATTGVVSGLNRESTTENGTIKGLIQFDAAVNHGSSGGPLVNAKGELIGIVIALANPTEEGTFIGVGFAVPIGTAVAAGRGSAGPPGPQQ
jgi:S1-C subfamily serine protease